MKPLAPDLLESGLPDNPPQQMSPAACRFYRQHLRDLRYFTLDLHVLEALEELLDSVGTAISEVGKLDQTPREILYSRFHTLDHLHQQVSGADKDRGELVLVRYVDSLLVYVAELLTAVFTHRPESLRSQEQVSLEDVLRHASLDDFIQWAADRRVTALSFKGLSELEDYFEERLQLPLVSDHRLRDWLVEAVATRNLLVHRRGIVDERFLRAVSDASAQRGDRITVPGRHGFQAMTAAVLVVLDLDGRAVQKFALPVEEASIDKWWSDIDDRRVDPDSLVSRRVISRLRQAAKSTADD